MKDIDEGTPLGDGIDLDEWPTMEPPADFADRVMAEVQVKPRRRWIPALVAGGGTIAIAAAVLLGIDSRPAVGEAIAKDRVEVAIGKRALAVLEPGADVRWNGDDVVQAHGDVFYRVEPGAKFTVHTPGGDVEVKGTCFSVKVRELGSREEGNTMQKRDMKVAAVSTALSALAFVAVYEGKVAVSHASERVDLAAGETAQTGPGGVKRTTGESDRAIDRAVALTEDSEDPQARANKNLVRQVGEYRGRLEAIVGEKADLEAKLKKSEDTLAAAKDGAPVVLKSSYDVDADEWKELAKDGTIKYQVPCIDAKGGGWTPQPKTLDKLGLAPQDGPTLKSAYQRSSQRLWATIKPLCAAAVGTEDIAQRIGPDTCTHLILDLEMDRDPEGTQKARALVGAIRSGAAPMPGPNEPMHPVAKLFLALTGSSKALEDDLAQSLGPEDAHRVVYADGVCKGQHIFGGSPSK